MKSNKLQYILLALVIISIVPFVSALTEISGCSQGTNGDSNILTQNLSLATEICGGGCGGDNWQCEMQENQEDCENTDPCAWCPSLTPELCSTTEGCSSSTPTTCLMFNGIGTYLDCQGYSIIGKSYFSGLAIGDGGTGGLHIKNCKIEGIQTGIFFNSGGTEQLKNNTIENSYFKNISGMAIYNDAFSEVKIIGNTFESIKQYDVSNIKGGTAVMFDFTYNNQIENNTFIDNRIAIDLTHLNRVGFGCSPYSIYNPYGFCEVSNTNIQNNSFNANEYAVMLETSTGINITHNYFIDNLIALDFFKTENSTIIDNFIDSTKNFNATSCSATWQNEASFLVCKGFDNQVDCENYSGCLWDNTTERINYFNESKIAETNIVGGANSGGNYWNDYLGVDVNLDGIGDTPYLVYGSASIYDELPLFFSEEEENIAPVLSDINITPVIAYDTDTLNCSVVYTDDDNNNGNVTITFSNSTDSYFNTINSVTSGSLVSLSLPFITVTGDTINCSAIATDGIDNSNVISKTKYITNFIVDVLDMNFVPILPSRLDDLNCSGIVLDNDLSADIDTNITFFVDDVFNSTSIFSNGSNGQMYSKIINNLNALQVVRCEITMIDETDTSGVHLIERTIILITPIIESIALTNLKPYLYPNCSVVVSDLDMGALDINFTLYNNSNYLSSVIKTINAGEMASYSISPQVNGVNVSCQVFAIEGDEYSNVSVISGMVTNIPPTIDSIALNSLSNIVSPNCSVVAGDIDTNIVDVNISFYKNNIFISSTVLTVGTGNLISYSVAPQTIGSNISCRAYANDGDSNGVMEEVSGIVGIVSVILNTPTDSQILIDGSNVLLSATTTDVLNNCSFYNQKRGTSGWSLIGTNNTIGTQFTYLYNVPYNIGFYNYKVVCQGGISDTNINIKVSSGNTGSSITGAVIDIVVGTGSVLVTFVSIIGLVLLGVWIVKKLKEDKASGTGGAFGAYS